MSDARKALLVIGVRSEPWPRRSQYCDVETLSSTASLWCVFILTYYYGKQIKCKVVWHLCVNKKLLLIAALWRLRRNTQWVEGGSFPFNESTRVTIIEGQGHIIKMRFGWHCFWKRMRHLQRKYCSGLAIWRFSLTPTSGLHIREKKQVVGVLAHSLPMVLPEGLPWKQGARQALGGPATAAGTSFLTGWWRHQLHTKQNNNYWRRKREGENDASSVNCCVDEMFISEFGEHIQGPYCLFSNLQRFEVSIPGDWGKLIIFLTWFCLLDNT